MDAMFKMDNYTATMATRVDLVSFFPQELGRAPQMEIIIFILR